MLQPPMSSTTWDELVEDYYDSIYRFCYQLSGNAADAEEITQDVFLKAFQRIHELNDATKVRGWLYSIARNACYDQFRWVKRVLQFKSSTEARAEVMMPQEGRLSQALLTHLQQLPRGQREVFVLRHWHEHSTRETAELLGVHEGSVKRQLKRAVDSLKEALLQEAEESTKKIEAYHDKTEGN